MKKENRLMDAINCSPTEKFTQIPNDLLRNPDISGKAKAILCILLSNKHGWRSYITTLQKIMKEGRDAIRSGIRELEQNDYLRRIRYRDAETKQYVGMFWAYANAQGQFNIENHMNTLKNKGLEAVKPRPENPPAGTSAAENTALKRLSNKKIKEKNINKKKRESEKNFSPKKSSHMKKEKNISENLIPDIKKVEDTLFFRLTGKIIDILSPYNNIAYTVPETQKFLFSIRTLVLDKEVSEERIDTALDWYSNHVKERFTPAIHNGNDLYNKFTNIEAAMVRYNKKSKKTSPENRKPIIPKS